jgi:hypothetical protein
MENKKPLPDSLQIEVFYFGGGGGNRTPVLGYQYKSFYMFILIFGFPRKASTGGILPEYPL